MSLGLFPRLGECTSTTGSCISSIFKTVSISADGRLGRLQSSHLAVSPPGQLSQKESRSDHAYSSIHRQIYEGAGERDYRWDGSGWTGESGSCLGAWCWVAGMDLCMRMKIWWACAYIMHMSHTLKPQYVVKADQSCADPPLASP